MHSLMNMLRVLLAGEGVGGGGVKGRKMGKRNTCHNVPSVTLKMTGGSESWQEDQKSLGVWTLRKLK